MEAGEDLYRIGAVAAITGIATERLRAWERRYGLAPAQRNGRTRFYDRDQITQLNLIRQLIDQGHPISTLAGLSTEQLASRLAGEAVALPGAVGAETIGADQASAAGTARPAAMRTIPASGENAGNSRRAPVTGLIGTDLLVLELAQPDVDRVLDVQGRWPNIEAFLDDRDQRVRLDTVVIQMPVLMAHRLEAVAAAQPQARLVALYQFATPKHLESVGARGIPTMSWPASWSEITHACTHHAARPLRASRPTARRFADADLIAIAASATETNGCPQHLVALISRLNAFAEFSANCAESVSADRGAIYDRLHTDTTQARAQLELALATLLEATETGST